MSASESIGLDPAVADYSENSRIIEVLTHEYGRIALVARVASKKSGSRSSGMQPPVSCRDDLHRMKLLILQLLMKH